MMLCKLKRAKKNTIYDKKFVNFSKAEIRRFSNLELDPKWSQLLYCIAAANHHMTSRETMDIVFSECDNLLC